MLAAGLVLLSWTVRAAEERFDMLQIGTRTYTNVTVTTATKKYVFILYDGGMTSIKPADLPPDIQEKLGYGPGGGPKVSTNTAVARLKREMAKISVPQVKIVEKQLEQQFHQAPPAFLATASLLGPKLIYIVLGIGLLLHLFYSYCCLLICRKAGKPPGFLVWVPGLQCLPLLSAANMSRWWFLAFFVPLLNLVPFIRLWFLAFLLPLLSLVPVILWCFNIAKARGKSAWVGFLLLLPVIGLFAFLYLAFSEAAPTEDEEGPEAKIMTLAAT